MRAQLTFKLCIWRYTPLQAIGKVRCPTHLVYKLVLAKVWILLEMDSFLLMPRTIVRGESSAISQAMHFVVDVDRL